MHPSSIHHDRSNRLWCADSRRAFSLIELIIVILIMGTVAAIALPRLSRGADNADETALHANFQVLNRALEMYTIEHTDVPTVNQIANQLTRYTNKDGTTILNAPDPSTGVIYGPYVVKIPPVPAGPKKGESGISDANGPKVGWIYQPDLRRIIPNLQDDAGTVPPDLVETMRKVTGTTTLDADLGAP